MQITVLLLTNSLEYLRGTSQVLQTLTSLLLTAYVALLGAVGESLGLLSMSVVVTGLPIALFTLSLALLFVRAATYRGEQFTFHDIDGTLKAYEAAVQERRKQLVAPSILTLLGIASFALVLWASG